jgi:hypothetical protein
MLSITLWWFADGVAERVVPGQTRTSPPLARLITAVSEAAVMEEPVPVLFPAMASGPAERTEATTGGGAEVRLATVGA